MRLYSSKIPMIASEAIRTLTQSEAIAVENASEAELDLQAIMKEYLRLEREVTEKAKEALQERGLPYEQVGRVKKGFAREYGIGFGEDALEWITNQFLESFMNSPHIEEVYAEDNEIRRSLVQILKRHMAADAEIDQEVRRRIKNMDEGTQTWEVEYNKALEQIKRNRGLE